MVDVIQIILLVVIIIVAIVLVVIGIQVYFFLKEARTSLKKANKIIDETARITESVSGPLSSLSALTSGVKASTLLGAAKLIKNLLSKESDSK